MTTDNYGLLDEVHAAIDAGHFWRRDALIVRLARQCGAHSILDQGAADEALIEAGFGRRVVIDG